MNATESAQRLRSSGLPRCRWIMFPLLAMLAFCPTVTLFGQPSAYTVHALQEVVLDDTQYQTFANSVTNVDDDGLRLVAGYARRDDIDLQPVVWAVNSAGGSVHALLNFPWFFAGAGASEVNHHGQIIGNGRFDLAAGGSLGLYWPDAASAPVLLPGLIDETSSQVLRINDSGVVVGISQGAWGSRAVAWRILADDTIVGPLVLPTRPRASGGNDSAFSVGVTSGDVTSIVGSSAGAAVVWRVKTVNASLTLEGAVEVLDSTGQATGINSTGAICGNDRSRSVIWEPLSGKKRSKTQLNDNKSLFRSPGEPNAITDGGIVVGSALLKDIAGPADQRVVIWTSRTAPMRTLESLILGDYPFLYLVTAYAVNADGEVVGYGWQGQSAGGNQAFIALP